MILTFIQLIISKINLKTLALIGLAAYAIFITLENRHHAKLAKINKVERDQAVKFATDQKNTTSFYVNQYRDKVAKIKGYELTENNYRRLINTNELKHLQHIEGLNKRINKLEHDLQINAILEPNLKPVEASVIFPESTPKDTTKTTWLEWKVDDEFNHINGLMVDTPRIKLPIYAVITWRHKKKFLFIRYGPAEFFLQAFTPNKQFKVDSLRIMSVTKVK